MQKVRNFFLIIFIALGLTIELHAQCNMDVRFDYVQNCTSFEFSNTSAAGPHIIDSVLWDFGDGSFSQENPTSTHTYISEGNYNMSLTVYYDGDCESSLDTNLYILKNPVSLSHHKACLNDTAVLMAEVDTVFPGGTMAISPYRFFWKFENTSYSEGGMDTSMYIDAYGTRLAHFVLENSIHCYDTLADTIQVSPIDVDFTMDSVCAGEVTAFHNLSSSPGDPIISYLWDLGDGVQSVVPSPVHEYADTGQYLVHLTVTTQQGCEVSDSGYAKVNFKPVFDDILIENRCSPSKTKFSIIVPDSDMYLITSVIWEFNDHTDTTSSLENYHLTQDVGYHSVKIKVFSGGCADSTTKNFWTFPVPISKFSYQTQANNILGNVKFDNQSVDATESPLSFEWDFGDGTISTDRNPLKRYEDDSIYTVQLVAKNKYSCYDTTRQEVSIHLFGLHIPTAMSPGDMDPELALFKPKGYKLAKYKIIVFNNKGEVLWQSDKLDELGRPVESWDGYYKGKLMPVGTYYWKAEAVFQNGDRWKGSTLQSETPQTTGTLHLIN